MIPRWLPRRPNIDPRLPQDDLEELLFSTSFLSSILVRLESDFGSILAPSWTPYGPKSGAWRGLLGLKRPKATHHGPRRPQDRPRRSQGPPRSLRDAPRAAKDPSRAPSDSPKRSKIDPRHPQNDQKLTQDPKDKRQQHDTTEHKQHNATTHNTTQHRSHRNTQHNTTTPNTSQHNTPRLYTTLGGSYSTGLP